MFGEYCRKSFPSSKEGTKAPRTTFVFMKREKNVSHGWPHTDHAHLLRYLRLQKSWTGAEINALSLYVNGEDAQLASLGSRAPPRGHKDSENYGLNSSMALPRSSVSLLVLRAGDITLA